MHSAVPPILLFCFITKRPLLGLYQVLSRYRGVRAPYWLNSVQRANSGSSYPNPLYWLTAPASSLKHRKGDAFLHRLGDEIVRIIAQDSQSVNRFVDKKLKIGIIIKIKVLGGKDRVGAKCFTGFICSEHGSICGPLWSE